MNPISLRRSLSRFLVGVAYFTCTMQWLWLAMIALPPLIDSGALNQFFEVEQPIKQESAKTDMAMSPLMMAVVGGITVLMIIVTIVIIVKLPKAVAGTGDALMQATTKAVLPAVVHHKKVSAKKRKLLTKRIMRIIQVCVGVLPFLAVILLPSPKELPAGGVMVVATALAVLALSSFALSWLIEPQEPLRKR